MKKLRMLSTIPGSINGISTKKYIEGKEYRFRETSPGEMALFGVFIDNGFAVEVSEDKMIRKAPETKRVRRIRRK